MLKFDREKVDGLVAAWLEENVKKGWSEAGAAPVVASPSGEAKSDAADGSAESPKPKKRASKKTATEG